jgi:putative membrane protein
MKRSVILFASCFGALAAIYLTFDVGVHSVFAAISSLRWTGFAIICCLLIGVFAVLSAGWCVLIPGGFPKNWLIFLWGRAVRDSAGDILPLTQVGGFVIGARAIALRNIAASDAFASTVVDITAEMLAQILFVFAGGILLVGYLGFHSRLILPLCLGSLLAALGVAGFIFAQQRGYALAEKLVGRLLPKLGPQAEVFAGKIREIYAAPKRVIASVSLHFVGWLAVGSFGWAAIRLIGVHISYGSMIAIESILSGVRSAAVIVPSGLGIQEATYAMIMPLFGVGPEIGVALSLIKRACSITIGIPVLLSWQSLEGRETFIRARSTACRTTAPS